MLERPAEQGRCQAGVGRAESPTHRVPPSSRAIKGRRKSSKDPELDSETSGGFGQPASLGEQDAADREDHEAGQTGNSPSSLLSSISVPCVLCARSTLLGERDALWQLPWPRCGHCSGGSRQQEEAAAVPVLRAAPRAALGRGRYPLRPAAARCRLLRVLPGDFTGSCC